MPTNGLVTMTPTSVTKTGGGSSSISINSNGSVSFSLCTSILLNGVFTSNYDNYMITMRYVGGSFALLQNQFAASGSADSTANSYVTQLLTSSSTTVSASRSTASSEGWVGYTDTTQRSGLTIYVFGPRLSQATAWTSRTVSGQSDATVRDTAGTHNQAVSYDGIRIYPFVGTGNDITGLITVYGFNQ